MSAARQLAQTDSNPLGISESCGNGLSRTVLEPGGLPLGRLPGRGGAEPLRRLDRRFKGDLQPPNAVQQIRRNGFKLVAPIEIDS